MVLAVLTLAVIGGEWHGHPAFGAVSAVLAAVALAMLVPHGGRTGRAFAVVVLVLSLAVVLTGPGWHGVAEALRKSAFIAAFFAALTSLRHAADTSPAIARCGRFLAEQPPGRRYVALTAGGHVFALLLNYGAIALLGGLALASARAEPDAGVRAHRTRRMLLAIQRGFVASLPWSPLAFAMAVSTAMVPGATWAGAVLPCTVSSAILMLAGWALDRRFKPRPTGPRPASTRPEGDWRLVLPLPGLLAILIVSVGTLHLLTGIRAVGVVILVVPALSLCWWALQGGARPFAHAARRGAEYVTRNLPRYRGETLVLMMAGLIGTLGGQLLAPLAAAGGVDPAALPGWAVLLGLLWGIPLLGQIGANPILAVTLLAPILPPPAALGLAPSDYILAMTSGWALSGATSPYTATTLLTASFGGVSARHVGLVWNGGFALTAGVLLSGWVLIAAAP